MKINSLQRRDFAKDNEFLQTLDKCKVIVLRQY